MERVNHLNLNSSLFVDDSSDIYHKDNKPITVQVFDGEIDLMNVLMNAVDNIAYIIPTLEKTGNDEKRHATTR